MITSKRIRPFIFLSLFVLLCSLILGSINLNPNVKYGIPFNSNFIINRPQYVIGYNKTTNRADWVSWELNNNWLGKITRSNVFVTDTTLPSDYIKVTSFDYVNSDFDRGHMANSEDRSNNQINNDSTFILSNILPQRPDNNRGPWKYLEEYCRTLVKSNPNYSLYIVSGPIGDMGKLKGKVTIPTSFYKTVLIEDKGIPVKGFAVMMPNVQGIVNVDWRNYLTSIRKVETVTNYNFYPTVDKNKQNQIETTIAYN